MKTFIVALVTILAGAVDAQVANQCVICPNGAVDADGGDLYDIPVFANDPRTFGEIIQEATSIEAGSDDCGNAAIEGIYCCPGAPVNPCIICPNGATYGDDFSPDTVSGIPSTCADHIGNAKKIESGSDACRLYVNKKADCCPPVTASPTTTSNTLNPSTAPPVVLTLPPVAAMTPAPTPAPTLETTHVCSICPNGAINDYGGDSFTPYVMFGIDWTCVELINNAKNFFQLPMVVHMLK
jgi:hypothetical protein